MLLLVLIVLAVIITGPVIGYVLLFRRIKSPKKRVILTAAYIGIPVILLFVFGFWGSTRARVARDHSVSLPVSASQIRCEGVVSLPTFGDFSADVSFEISAADLPALLSAFKWDPDTATPDIDPLSKRMSVPSHFGEITSLRSGMSRNGNRVYLQTHNIGDGRIGVCIYTIWN